MMNRHRISPTPDFPNTCNPLGSGNLSRTKSAKVHAVVDESVPSQQGLKPALITPTNFNSNAVDESVPSQQGLKPSEGLQAVVGRCRVDESVPFRLLRVSECAHGERRRDSAEGTETGRGDECLSPHLQAIDGSTSFAPRPQVLTPDPGYREDRRLSPRRDGWVVG